MRTFSDRKLVEPHIEIGRTAPRSLGHVAPTTGHGGTLAIILNQGLVFGTNPDWVRSPWPPAEGTGRFTLDLLLQLSVQQFVLEASESQDLPSYKGFGPVFTEFANRIGQRLGLRAVVVRRRGGDDANEPVATGWPHNVRVVSDPHHYGDDVTVELLDLATGSRNATRCQPAPPSLGQLEYFLFLLASGRADRLRDLLVRHVDRLQRQRERRGRSSGRIEAGELDVDGQTPLGEVTIEPVWLAQNNGVARKMVEAIDAWRDYSALPLLADALEDAGCNDARILRHLRAEIEHNCNCWVVGQLLASGQSPQMTEPEPSLRADNQINGNH